MFNLILLLVVITACNVWAEKVTQKAKVNAVYHSMCGCSYVFWINHFEGEDDDVDFTSATQDNDAFGGTSKSNLLSTALPAGNYYSMEFPTCVVSDYMQGKNTRLLGRFKSPKLKYTKIYAQYKKTVIGQPNPLTVKMDEIRILGKGDWKEFEYYFDFTGETSITEVKLFASVPVSDDGLTNLQIRFDEFEMCKYCEGIVENPVPTLSNIEMFKSGTEIKVGKFNPVFDPEISKYIVIVPQSMHNQSVQVKPYLTTDPQFTGTMVTVNGIVVPAGQKSVAIALNLLNQSNYPVINIKLIKQKQGSACELINHYELVLIPEEPLPNANLADLKFVDNKHASVVEQVLWWKYNYTGLVDPGITKVKIIPLAEDPKATVTVNMVKIDEPGDPSQEIDIVLNNVITIVVTSRDGLQSNTYTLTCIYKTPKVQFLGSEYSGDESVLDVFIKVTIFPTFPRDVYIPCTFSGTASSADYDVVENWGVIKIFANKSDADIHIKVFENQTVDIRKTIIMTLGEPYTGFQGDVILKGEPSVCTYTIIDNDEYSVSFSPKTDFGIEPELGKTMAVPVTLTLNSAVGANKGPVKATIEVDQEHSTAQQGELKDFYLEKKSFIWNTGDGASKTFNMVVCSDDIIEGQEKVVLKIQTVSGGKPGADNTYEYIILDAITSSILYVDYNAIGGLNNGNSWENAFVKLQDALYCAKNKTDLVKEVHVARGTYYPDEGIGITNNDRNAAFEVPPGLKLTGGFVNGGTASNPAVNETILHGDIEQNDNEDPGIPINDPRKNNNTNSFHIVTCTDIYNVSIIDGFTIIRGYADGVNLTGYGAAICGASDIKNCIIKENFTSYGGSVCRPKTVMSCSFKENYLDGPELSYDTKRQYLGDYLYPGGAAINGGNLLEYIINCTFEYNHASNTRIGGAVFIDSSQVQYIKGCKYVSNYSGMYGGAIFIIGINSTISNPIVSCSFISNSSRFDGGAIYCDQSASQMSPRQPSKIDIANCLFYNNSSDGNGGSIYDVEGSMHNVINCTFTHNIANGIGSAILWNNGTLISNCIFWDNIAGSGLQDIYTLGTPVNVSYSDVQSTEYIAQTSAHNFIADPLFISVDPVNNDFLKLSPHSGCINAGDNSIVPETEDIIGNPRIQPVSGGTVDLGAYETDYAGVNRFNFTINASLHCTVNPGGTQSVIPCQLIEITSTPESGYVFDRWLIESGNGIVFVNQSSASTRVKLTSGDVVIRALVLQR